MTAPEGYPPEWPERARAVKDEVDWRCLRCGHLDLPELAEILEVPRGMIPCDEEFCTHPDAEPGAPPAKKRVLTVHHFDGDKANLRWWNLLPLCQVCHLSVQSRVRPEQTYLHPHSDWILAHVAGFYVETIEGLEVPRDFVEARLVECLAVGQPHLEEHYRRRLEDAA